MSIKLFFRKFFNEEIEKKIRNYEIVRLMGRISFKTHDGWLTGYGKSHNRYWRSNIPYTF